MKPRVRAFFVGACLAVVVGQGSLPPARAAPPARVVPSLEAGVPAATVAEINACSRLDEALAVLSRKYAVGFVVEGRPYRDAAQTEAPLAQMPVRSDRRISFGFFGSSDGSGDVPLWEVLTQIGLAYDYIPERSGPLVILRKSYRNPADPAEVTSAEIAVLLRHAGELTRRFTRPLTASREASPTYQAFARSLNPEQIALMRRDTMRPDPYLRRFADEQARAFAPSVQRQFQATPSVTPDRLYPEGEMPGVSVGSLTPSQQTFVRSLAVARWLPTENGALWPGERRANLLGSFSTLRIEKVSGALWVNFGKTLDGRLLPDLLLDTSAATAAPPGLPRWEEGATTVTLEDLPSWLQQEAASVAPELHGKRVTLVGLERAAPHDVMRAVADVFHLRLIANSHFLRLAPPVLPPVRNAAQVPDVLRTLMPRPLLTIFDGEPGQLSRFRPAPISRGGFTPLANEDSDSPRPSQRLTRQTEQLRARLQARADAAPSRIIGWNALGTEEKSQATLAIGWKAIAAVHRLASPYAGPAYISEGSYCRVLAAWETSAQGTVLTVRLVPSGRISQGGEAVSESGIIAPPRAVTKR